MTQALPKHVQLSERLIRQIAAGQLADGARLPPERAMAAELGVSVGTLRKALDDLTQKGLLRRVHGSGNYVRRRAAAQGVYSFFRLELPGGGGLPGAVLLDLAQTDKPATPPFGTSAGQAHRLRRLRLLDGMAVALEEIWLDAGPQRGLDPARLSESLYHYFEQALGLRIGRVEDRVGIGVVPDWAPSAFGLSPGAPVGHVLRLGWAEHGPPVEFSQTWFDNSRSSYIFRAEKDIRS